MNHRYIDESSVAERYLEHTLAPGERADFEAHLASCEECADRLLLAQIFLDRREGRRERDRLKCDPRNRASQQPFEWSEADAEGRNGSSGSAHVHSSEPLGTLPNPAPWPAEFVAQFKPWQLVALLAAGAALLLSVPTMYYLWELAKIRGAH